MMLKLSADDPNAAPLKHTEDDLEALSPAETTRHAIPLKILASATIGLLVCGAVVASVASPSHDDALEFSRRLSTVSEQGRIRFRKYSVDCPKGYVLERRNDLVGDICRNESMSAAARSLALATRSTCPAGYTIEPHPSPQVHGDVCRKNDGSRAWDTPTGCERANRRWTGPPYAAMPYSGSGAPEPCDHTRTTAPASNTCTFASSFNTVCAANDGSGQNGWAGDGRTTIGSGHTDATCQAACADRAKVINRVGCCEWRTNGYCLFREKGYIRASAGHTDTKAVLCGNPQDSPTMLSASTLALPASESAPTVTADWRLPEGCEAANEMWTDKYGASEPSPYRAVMKGTRSWAVTSNVRNEDAPAPVPCDVAKAAKIAYPLNSTGVGILKTTTATSPVRADDPVESLVDSALLSTYEEFEPTHPDETDDAKAAQFWDEFEKVVDFAVIFRQDDCPGLALPSGDATSRGCTTIPHARQYLELPQLMSTFTLADGAEAVLADFPNHWPSELVKHFLGQGAQMDDAIIPQRSHDDFVSRHVLLSRIAGWAVSVVSPTAFACKWKYGRARPEEVAWDVAQGLLPGAPPSVVTKIQGLRLSSAADFTTYAIGSPKHPSFPAMHSAASSASLWLCVVMDLSLDQKLEARRLDWAVSRFRTVAGVHYDSDNRVGLKLGQDVVAKQLPEFLENVFPGRIDRTENGPLMTKIRTCQSEVDWMNGSFGKGGDLKPPS